MSTRFVVDDEHIHVILHAGLRPHENGPLTWQVPTWIGDVELTDDTADYVGQMLLEQNYKSAIGDDAQSREYLHRPPYHDSWQDTEILAALHCYRDQASGTANWQFSEARAFCETLERRMIANMPGYRCAQAWPITAASVPLAVAGLHLVGNKRRRRKLA